MESVKFMTAQEAVKLIKSGDGVYFQGSTAVPELIQEALAQRGRMLRFTVPSAYREELLPSVKRNSETPS